MSVSSDSACSPAGAPEIPEAIRDHYQCRRLPAIQETARAPFRDDGGEIFKQIPSHALPAQLIDSLHDMMQNIYWKDRSHARNVRAA
jgi:hypothetical protein